MKTAPLPAELAAATPGITARFGVILRALHALIAAAFLRDPRHLHLIWPLCNYIDRTLQRLERVIARAVAGTLRPSRPGRTAEPTSARAPARLPRRRAWLVEKLGYHAAGFGSQLNHLLNEPETKAIIAATPQAQRLLRPLCHLLGITPDCIRKPPAPRPKPARAPAHEAVAEPPAPPRYTSPPCPRLANRWPWNGYPVGRTGGNKLVAIQEK